MYGMVAMIPVSAMASRQPAIAVASSHEIGGSDVAVLVADRPRAGKDPDPAGTDRSQRCAAPQKNPSAPAPVHQSWNRDESISRIKVAADQERR